jgi:hypothetical protein
MNVVIMAAGRSKRWHAATAKHMALVDGEPVLYRTVRLLRRRGLEPVVTARQSGQWPLFNEHVSSPNDCEIDRVYGARQFAPAVFLYGDCCYTEGALEEILADQHDWQFFGRRGASRVKSHGEIFAIKANDYVIGHAEQLRHRCVGNPRLRCLGWDLYGRCASMGAHWSFQRARRNFTQIDDGTDDFDTVEEYLKFLSRQRAPYDRGRESAGM